jgi:hypothetical protein
VREEVFHASFLEEEFIPSFSISVEEWRGLGESILFNLKSEVLGSFVFAEKVKLKVPEKMPEGWQWIEPGILKYGHYPPRKVSIFKLKPGVYQIRWGVEFPILRKIEPPADPRLKAVRALASGRLAEMGAGEGAVVPAGTALAWVHSEGWVIPHAVSQPVRIAKWHVRPEDWVEMGDLIAEVIFTH